MQARIPHVEGGQQRPDEMLDHLRIPSFPVSVRKEEVFNQYLNMLMYDVGSKQLLM